MTRLFRFWCFVACGALAAGTAVPAYADLVVYDDAATSGWLDWSWGGVTRDFAQSGIVHDGGAAIAVTYTAAWSGLKLARFAALGVLPSDTLRFQVHGGATGGQKIQVLVNNAGTGASASVAFEPVAGAWVPVEVPLAALGAPFEVTSIQWFNATDGAQAVFYLDDVVFVASGAPPPQAVAGPGLRVGG